VRVLSTLLRGLACDQLNGKVIKRGDKIGTELLDWGRGKKIGTAELWNLVKYGNWVGDDLTP